MTTTPALSSPAWPVNVCNHKWLRVVHMIQTVRQQDHASWANALQVRALRNPNQGVVLQTPTAAMTIRATKHHVSKMNAHRFLSLVAALQHWIVPSNRPAISLSVSTGCVAYPLSKTVAR